MRKMFTILVLAAVVATAVPALAELQNVQVGGSIRIRGSYYSASAVGDTANGRNPLFQGPFPFSWGPYFNNLLGIQGLRWAAAPGRAAMYSPLSFNDDGHALKFIEQRTRLNVKADFTDAVSAFIELDSYDVWGEDFRSNYLTGVDGRANTADDVEVYQAYIEANDMFGYPLMARIGRQEMVLGSGWLMGDNSASSFFTGLSFDGIRLAYATDMFSVTALMAKLAENSPAEEDGDVDLYGVYASYLGVEDMTFDAYWLYVRDAIERRDTPYWGEFAEWWQDVVGVDDYGVTALHTVGLRAAGMYGAFDFEAEAAYQFGDADGVGVLANGLPKLSPYGDDDAEFDAWAANLEVGYTFDMNYTPRVFLGFAYFDGEDNTEVSFGDWLAALTCPYWKGPDQSYAFNRLFSNWEYSEFLDATDLTNCWIARGGVSAMPTEDIEVALSVAYMEAVDPYAKTWPNYFILGNRVTWFRFMSWHDEECDDDLGWEVALNVTYNYTEDLSFEVGWSHLFTGDGLETGNGSNILNNGLGFAGGTDDDDADYVYVETKLCF